MVTRVLLAIICGVFLLIESLQTIRGFVTHNDPMFWRGLFLTTVFTMLLILFVRHIRTYRRR